MEGKKLNDLKLTKAKRCIRKLGHTLDLMRDFGEWMSTLKEPLEFIRTNSYRKLIRRHSELMIVAWSSIKGVL